MAQIFAGMIQKQNLNTPQNPSIVFSINLSYEASHKVIHCI